MKKTIDKWGTCLKKIPLRGLLCLFMVCCWVQTFAQEQTGDVNINVTNVSVKEVLEIIKKHDYRLVYSAVVVDACTKKVTMKKENATVEEILNEALKGTDLTFNVEGRLVTIKKADKDKVLLVKGVVRDENGEPMPGVTVLVKGTTMGTATDVNGKFQIRLPQGKHLLEISFIGMKTLTVEATPDKEIVVQMESDVQVLKETVVTGIYTRNIESFTGAVTTFTKEELKQVNPTSVLKSLSILDPSFIITENRLQGSNPNTMLDVSINGKINMTDLNNEYETNPNLPLFILDGFETTLEAIQDLNMDRVESISILKDAASTAIYGSKAANGVVVIETIKPKPGQLRLSYNGNFTVNWPDLSDFNLMNAAEKLEFEKLSGVYKTYKDGAWLNLDENGEIIGDAERARYYAKLKLVKEGYDTYWLNEPIRSGFNQTHNVFIDGGDASFLYGVGISYNHVTGVMKGSDRSVLNGNIRLTYRLDKFSFTNQTTFGNTKLNNNTVDFSAFSRMNPFFAKRNENGEVPKYVYKEGTSTYYWNPLWDMEQNSYNQGNTWSLSNNFQMEILFTRDLRLRANVQYNMAKSETEVFKSPTETAFVNTKDNQKGTFTKSNTSNSTWNGRLTLTYGRSFGNHTFNGVGGMSFSDNSMQTYSFMAQGYSTDMFSNPNFSAGYPEGGRPSSTDKKSRNVSYYLNFNYSYLMRYLLDFNYTNSGSSQFGINDPFTTTWAFGVGWNLHHESFLEGNPYITYLKLRYTYGNPGNQNYDAKLSSSIYRYITSGTNPFGLAALISTWGNNSLEWQRTNTHTFGLDMQLFNNRINFTANYQIRKTDPMLVRIDLPASTGTTTAPVNMGATDNRSLTATLTYYVIKNDKMNWYISGNCNHYFTEYYNIGNLLEEYNKEGRATASSLIRYYDGASITGLYTVRSAGIDPATGNEVFIKKDGTYTFEYDIEDEVLCGDMTPDLQGSFSSSFTYKGFSASVSFSYRIGAQIQQATLLSKVENISGTALNYNHDKRALYDRWQKPGDKAKFKRIDDTSNTPMSTRFIGTENVLECASINLGYRTTTAGFLKKIGASSFSFNAYTSNIFRIASLKEERGTNYPFERSVTFSIGVNF